MKKYAYYMIDLDETIYADSGDEFSEIYDATHSDPYEGNIELTVLETGEVRTMYHIKTYDSEKIRI